MKCCLSRTFKQETENNSALLEVFETEMPFEIQSRNWLKVFNNILHMYYNIFWYFILFYDIYDILWYFMIFYDILWYFMICYYILWYFMLCYVIFFKIVTLSYVEEEKTKRKTKKHYYITNRNKLIYVL